MLEGLFILSKYINWDQDMRSSLRLSGLSLLESTARLVLAKATTCAIIARAMTT